MAKKSARERAFKRRARAQNALQDMDRNDQARQVGALGGVNITRQRRVSRGGFRRKGSMTVARSQSAGSVMGNPAVDLAYALRRRLKPLRIAPCLIANAEGVVIAEIRTDPVTGKRTRVPR